MLAPKDLSVTTHHSPLTTHHNVNQHSACGVILRYKQLEMINQKEETG
jgi:hypothetical protein